MGCKSSRWIIAVFSAVQLKLKMLDDLLVSEKVVQANVIHNTNDVNMPLFMLVRLFNIGISFSMIWMESWDDSRRWMLTNRWMKKEVSLYSPVKTWREAKPLGFKDWLSACSKRNGSWPYDTSLAIFVKNVSPLIPTSREDLYMPQRWNMVFEVIYRRNNSSSGRRI